MSGMIPSTNWGQKHRLDREPLGEDDPQVLLCHKCLLESSTTPAAPQQIVMVGGYSYCVSHARRVTRAT